MQSWVKRAVLAVVVLSLWMGLSGGDSRKVTLYLIGDSTMEDKVLEGNPERGWGQMLPFFLDDRVKVENHARAGRSSKSFIDEDLWDEVLRLLQPGDFVFIQFGHNDEKNQDSTRYTKPNTAYRSNLERLVRETRAKNAVPFLLTPVMRRRFDEKNAFFDTHGEYPDVVRKVAAEQNAPLIDLHRMTEKMVVDLGAEGSKKLFLWIEPDQAIACPNGLQDDTHFSEFGAEKVARLVAEDVRRQNLPLKKYVRIPKSFPSLNSGTVYLFAYFKKNGQDGLHLAFSKNGLQWTALNHDSSFLRPMAGRDKLMRDPFIYQGTDGTFHLVWTVSWKEKGIGYASSKDLIHWSDQKYLPVMEHEPSANNCWAPEMVYDQEKGLYLVFWSTTIPGRFPETDGQSSKGPPEPGLNHRIYCVTSPDMQTFSETRLFFDQGFNVIDADIVRDGKRYVMFLKDETTQPFPTQKNIRVAASEHDEGPYSPVSRPITGDFWAEGPSGIRIGSTWVVYFDRYREGRYGAVVSRDLVDWTDITDKLKFPLGARHGNAFRVPENIFRGLLNVK
jgi:lysophospholipase L1-like esterase